MRHVDTSFWLARPHRQQGCRVLGRGMQIAVHRRLIEVGSLLHKACYSARVVPPINSDAFKPKHVLHYPPLHTWSIVLRKKLLGCATGSSMPLRAWSQVFEEGNEKCITRSINFLIVSWSEMWGYWQHQGSRHTLELHRNLRNFWPSWRPRGFASTRVSTFWADLGQGRKFRRPTTAGNGKENR